MKAKNYVEAVYWSRYNADNEYRWYKRLWQHDKHPAILRAKYQKNSVLSLIRRLRWPKPRLDDWLDRDFLDVLRGWQSFKSELRMKRSNPFRTKWQKLRDERIPESSLHWW